MKLPIILRTEAQNDFDEAFDWYELREKGLGVSFAAQIQELFEQLSVNPKRYQIVLRDVRKAVVRRFPYSVFYRIESSHVLIFAIFHARRNQDILKNRFE